MGRIWQVAGPGFAPETTCRECLVGPQEARPQIVVCVRGEAFRIGGRGEQDPGLPTEEFEEILHSIGKNLVLPLTRKGYKVLLFGDIMSDEYRLHEVEQAFRRSLPNDTVMEICLKK